MSRIARVIEQNTELNVSTTAGARADLRQSGAAEHHGSQSSLGNQTPTWRDFDRATNGFLGNNSERAIEQALKPIADLRKEIEAASDPKAKAALEKRLASTLEELDKGFRDHSRHSHGQGIAEYVVRQTHGELREQVLNAFGHDPKAYALALRDAMNTSQTGRVTELLRELNSQPGALEATMRAFSNKPDGVGSLRHTVDKFFNDRIPEAKVPVALREEIAGMFPSNKPSGSNAQTTVAPGAAKPQESAHAAETKPATSPTKETETKHVSVAGDSLSKIARQALSADGNKPSNHDVAIYAQALYQKNRDKMPQGMNNLGVNVELALPTAEELAATHIPKVAKVTTHKLDMPTHEAPANTHTKAKATISGPFGNATPDTGAIAGLHTGTQMMIPTFQNPFANQPAQVNLELNGSKPFVSPFAEKKHDSK